ncbi:MAG: cytochrome P450 [Myxococcota bacterium]|jgi:cytochrome P450
MTIEFDPCHHPDVSDPYPFYRQLRDEAPIHRSTSTGALCIARYEDVAAVLKDSDTFSSSAMRTFLMNGGRSERPPLSLPALRFFFGLILRARVNPYRMQNGRNLISEDGPPHAEMRNIVNRGFTPSQVARLEVQARELVAVSMQILDAGGPFDLVRDLAIPLPVSLICEILGIEVGKREDFKRWSDAIVDVSTGPGRDAPFEARVFKTFLELVTYFSRIARQRAKHPGDDLISTIVHGNAGEESLSTLDVVNFVTLLMVAGNETTTNLIGNATLALLQHPEARKAVEDDLSLVPEAIEEALRYDAPIQLLFREATCDTEINGTRIAKGEIVVPLLGSANRDERQFDDPDVFRLGRSRSGHLGFGFGAHFCLGASLARLEARAALEGLVPRLSALEIEGPVPRIHSFLIRGPRQLKLRRMASAA